MSLTQSSAQTAIEFVEHIREDINDSAPLPFSLNFYRNEIRDIEQWAAWSPLCGNLKIQKYKPHINSQWGKTFSVNNTTVILHKEFIKLTADQVGHQRRDKQ